MLSPLDICALIAVMLVGLPHGAFDGAIAFFLGAGKSVFRMAIFLASYILLAGLYIGFWYLAPIAALGIFIILSIIHFGSGDIQPLSLSVAKIWQSAFRALRIFVHGGIVGVVVPSFYPSEVGRLYQVLIGGDAGIIMAMTAMVLPLWVAGFIIYMLASLKVKTVRWPVGEIAILTLLAALLPPLASFAIYFCLVHSRRHFLVIWTAMQEMLSRQLIIRMASILTLITWAGAGLAFYLQADLASVSLSDAALRTVFISLAALTLPHMVLVDAIFRPVFLKKVHA